MREEWIVVAASAWSAAALAAGAPAPSGLWQVIGDFSGQPEALVRIVEADGEFRGTVTRVFSPPAQSSDPRCEQCVGERRDQPVVGMTILWGLRKEDDQYGGGTILDPDEGTEYRCSAVLREHGEILEVRGYVGIPLLGRTQRWRRVE